MTTRISNRDLEALSAYLDGEISADQKQALETRFKSENNLLQAYLELRRTRMVLRSAPRVRAPRNFTLTPRMAGVRPTRNWSFPVLSMASAVAGLLFILVLLGDLYTTRQSLPTTLQLAQGEATEAFELKAPPEETQQPLIESIPPQLESELGADKSKLTAPLPTQEGSAAAQEAVQTTPEPTMSAREMQLAASPTEEGYPSPLAAEVPGETVTGGRLQPTGTGVLFLRAAEIVLMLIALISGTAAIVIFRKQRS